MCAAVPKIAYAKLGLVPHRRNVNYGVSSQKKRLMNKEEEKYYEEDYGKAIGTKEHYG